MTCSRFALLLTLMLLPVPMLQGCGGAGSQASSKSAQKSGLSITIHWPIRSRMIPISTQTIDVKISPQGATTVVSDVVISAPTGQSNTTVNVVPLPLGTFVATATANASGSAPLATGQSQPFTTSLNQTSTFTVDMTTTIDHLVLTGAPTVQVGQTVQLMASGVDASGDTVLVAQSNLSWASTTPTIATIDPQSGVATGVAAGSATITVTDSESDKSGQGALSVTAPTIIGLWDWTTNGGSGTQTFNADGTFTESPPNPSGTYTYVGNTLTLVDPGGTYVYTTTWTDPNHVIVTGGNRTWYFTRVN